MLLKLISAVLSFATSACFCQSQQQFGFNVSFYLCLHTKLVTRANNIHALTIIRNYHAKLQGTVPSYISAHLYLCVIILCSLAHLPIICTRSPGQGQNVMD